MNANDSTNREIERLLEAHFASGADNVPPTPDLWVWLEGRLGDQTPRPFWAGVRDRANPAEGFRGTLALAATAAVALVVVAAGSVWFVVGSGGGVPASGTVGPTDPTGPEEARGPSGLRATPTPLAMMEARATPTPLPAGVTPPPPLSQEALEAQGPIRAWGSAGSSGVPGSPGEPGSSGLPGLPGIPGSPGQHGTPTPMPSQGSAGAQGAQGGSPGLVPGGTTPQARLVPGGTTPQAEQRSSSGQPGATTFQDYARQPLIDAREDGVSTFSLDTDRTSFQLALNWVKSGYEVDPASVRAEEWVNAFDYGYAAPSASDRFAITSDLIAHPLDSSRHMARVAFKAPRVVRDGPLNVTLVLDASGSMRKGNRVAIAREAAEAIRRSLDADDRIAVVHFTTDVLDYLTVEHASPDDRAVADSIARLAPNAGTNVQAGLNLGVRLADSMRRARPEALNYVILMSDGVANVDATDPFTILEAASAPDGANPLRLITVGVGIQNYNDHLLEQLAQHGNGWYRYLFNEEQARSTFRRENWLALASPVADQTRAQVVWNPEAVKTWRIIGYENRVTSAESFTQNRKEFAEMYSGVATTVFYELELHDDFRRKDGLGQVELRWVEPGSGRAWSQSSDLVGGGEVVHPQEDPRLRFGAVVALVADRYSALGNSRESRNGYAQDLWSLRDRAEELRGDLGHLAAFRDFADVLESLLMSVPHIPVDHSGYSR